MHSAFPIPGGRLCRTNRDDSPGIVALGSEECTEANLSLDDSWKQYALSAPEFYKYKSFDSLEIEAALLNRLATTANRSCHSSL